MGPRSGGAPGEGHWAGQVAATEHPLPVQTGDVEIVNHKTKDRCQLKFLPYSYFSKEVARKVSTAASPSLGRPRGGARAHTCPANAHR